MGKWLNRARVRKREIDGKDTRIAALAAAGAVQIAGQVPVATAGLFAPALPAWEPGPKRSNQYLKRGIAPTGVIYMHIR